MCGGLGDHLTALAFLFLVVVLDQYVGIRVGVLSGEESRLGLALPRIISDSLLRRRTLALGEIDSPFEHRVAASCIGVRATRCVLRRLDLLIGESLLELNLLLHLELLVGQDRVLTGLRLPNSNWHRDVLHVLARGVGHRIRVGPSVMHVLDLASLRHELVQHLVLHQNILT